MTNSLDLPLQGKRERLVAGARVVIHQQGVEKTTIADIAREADVPVGNVYYYFKTKDELVEAAIDSHVETSKRCSAHWSATARRRRDSRRWSVSSPPSASSQPEYGCPLGSLCSELDKRTDGLHLVCAEMLRLPIDWSEQQFRLSAAATPATSPSR